MQEKGHRKRFDEEGLLERIRQRRSVREGLLEKVHGRKSDGEGLTEKVNGKVTYQKRGMSPKLWAAGKEGQSIRGLWPEKWKRKITL